MEQIANFFIVQMLKWDVISDCDKNIYAYGVRAMIQKAIFTTILFLVAFSINEVFYTVIFYVSFTKIRGIHGKFHSMSRISCFGWTAFICFLSYFIKFKVLDYIPLSVLVILLSIIFLVLTIIKLARNINFKLQAECIFLYIAFLVLCAWGYRSIAYGIFIAYICTAILECFYYLLIVTKWVKNLNKYTV